MCLNHENQMKINIISGRNIKCVEDFKYRGSYIGSTRYGVNVRIGNAWADLNSLNNIWKFNI